MGQDVGAGRPAGPDEGLWEPRLAPEAADEGPPGQRGTVQNQHPGLLPPTLS